MVFDPSSYIEQINALQSQGRMKEAIEMMQFLEIWYNENKTTVSMIEEVNILMHIAQLKATTKEWESSEDYFRQILASRFGSMLQGQAKLAMLEGILDAQLGASKHEEAMETVSQILSEPDDSPNVLRKKGGVLLKVERFDENIQFLRSAYETSRYDAPSYQLLRRALERKGDSVFQFRCPSCDEEYPIPIFPIDQMQLAAMTAYAKDKRVIPISLKYERCRKCDQMSTIYLTLCRNCTEGFSGEYLVKEKKKKKGKSKPSNLWQWIPVACNSCSKSLKIDKDNPQEQEFFSTMLHFNPEYQEAFKTLDEMERKMS